MISLTASDVRAVKGEVISAAFGICSLEEVELLFRLEELYWKGFKAALDRIKERDASAVHADSIRLDHLIARDRCVLALLEEGKPFTGGTVESIHFVFENPAGFPDRVTTPAEVREAIDRDIANLAARTATANVGVPS